MNSAYLWNSALRGLNCIGDVFLPENEEFPSFSQLGCIEMVDDMIAYLPDEDVKLLNIVLTLFSVAPISVLQGLVHTMEASLDKTGMIPSLMRQLNMGLRGILFGCYYSGRKGSGYNGPTTLNIIGYQTNRVVE